MNISIYNLIGNTLASNDDSIMVYSLLKKVLDKNEIIEIDFKNIDFASLPFLHYVIYNLYNNYTSIFLNEHVTFINIPNNIKFLLTKVIEVNKNNNK